MNIGVGIYVYGCLPGVILEVDMTSQLLHLVTSCGEKKEGGSIENATLLLEG